MVYDAASTTGYQKSIIIYLLTGALLMDMISERIKRLQKHFGWSNADLCEEAGATKQTVNKWINHNSTPSHKYLIRLRVRHKISDEWILSGKEPMILTGKGERHASEMIDIMQGLSDDQAEGAMEILRQYARGVRGRRE